MVADYPTVNPVYPAYGGPVLIGSEIYRGSSYGAKHPLAIPRVSTTLDLIGALGWLDPARYLDSPRATPDELARFHDPDYVACLQRAERDGAVSEAEAERFHIGRYGNPIYPEVFRRPATAAGATLAAARMIASGAARVVHNPAGGTHHGRQARASGFCYLNDPVLGIMALLDAGFSRVFYLDIDAHHGDGVEDAFADEDRVLTVSIHEAGRWPGTGGAADRAGGTARNLPVPAGFNDTEMAFVMEHAVWPFFQGFDPDVVVLQCGADAIEDDPLSKLSLSNNALKDVVQKMNDMAPRLIVLGGGGYNPWSVARCWTGIWAALNRYAVPDPLPPAAQAVLRNLRWDRAAGRNPPAHWFESLADLPRPGPVRDAVRAVVAQVMDEPVVGSMNGAALQGEGKSTAPPTDEAGASRFRHRGSGA